MYFVDRWIKTKVGKQHQLQKSETEAERENYFLHHQLMSMLNFQDQMRVMKTISLYANERVQFLYFETQAAYIPAAFMLKIFYLKKKILFDISRLSILCTGDSFAVWVLTFCSRVKFTLCVQLYPYIFIKKVAYISWWSSIIDGYGYPLSMTIAFN